MTHQPEPHLPGVLAIDAGNSKTDVALVGADGRVLGSARGGGFTPQKIGGAAAVAGLAPLVEEAAAAAGLTGWTGPLTSHVSACLANADLPVEEEALRVALESHPWGVSNTVVNDTFGLLRAGTDGPRGVAVVCGAGINCVGLLPDGRTARFPALGELTVAEAVHLGHLPFARLHEIVRVLFAVAGEGDRAALELIDRQADEITRLALVALRRLDLLDTPTPVVLGGGVLAARQSLLLDNLTDRLAREAPLAEPRVVVAPPVLGAVLLGLDHLRAGPQAQERARLAYDPTHPVAA